jgi:nucleotide-binding universal stress UspA family protein
MYHSIVVPLDGSPDAARTLPFAARLAATGNGQVVLTRAVLDPSQLVVTNASAARIAASRQRVAVAEARAELADVAEDSRTYGLNVTTRVAELHPSRAILEAVQDVQADLIVMATHSRPAPLRGVLGSVAEEVLRQSPVPLLLVPPACQHPWPANDPLRVLVALDGSQRAEQVINPAVRLAAALHAELLLVRMIDQDDEPADETSQHYLERVARTLGERGVSVQIRSSAGRPAEWIHELTAEMPAHAIAMATHGRSGLERLLMGSVTTEVLRRAAVPVLVVGPALACRASGRPG